MRLDRDQIDRIEENISPPMKYAITIPVECSVDGKYSVDGICIYVAASPFTALVPEAIYGLADSLLLEALRRVADSLTLVMLKRRV